MQRATLHMEHYAGQTALAIAGEGKEQYQVWVPQGGKKFDLVQQLFQEILQQCC